MKKLIIALALLSIGYAHAGDIVYVTDDWGTQREYRTSTRVIKYRERTPTMYVEYRREIDYNNDTPHWNHRRKDPTRHYPVYPNRSQCRPPRQYPTRCVQPSRQYTRCQPQTIYVRPRRRLGIGGSAGLWINY